MDKKIIFKIIICGLLLAGIGVFYFTFPLMITYDSSEYFDYLKILNGKSDLSNWNTVRGPVFPIIIFILTKTLGNTHNSLLIGTFLFYLLTIILGFLIIKNISYPNKKTRKVSYSIFFLLIIMNPILIGYMHTLLTEFIAIPFLLLASVLASSWVNAKSIKINMILSIVLILGCIFMWFLKQPYVFIFLAPTFVASIISILENRKIKNTVYRLGILLICIISLFTSNKLWNFILIKNDVDFSTNKNTNNLIKKSIINGNTAFFIDPYEEHYEKEYILESHLISEDNRQQIMKIIEGTSDYKSFKLIDVYNNFTSREQENIKEKIVMFSKYEEYSISDVIKMYTGIVISYPTKTIYSYFMNYLAISDIIAFKRHVDVNEYYPSTTEQKNYENHLIGYGIYNEDKNTSWIINSKYYNEIEHLSVNNTAPILIREIIGKLFRLYNDIYKIVIFLNPLLLIAFIIKRKGIVRKEYKNMINLGIITTASSFVHTMFHVVMGTVIDRYAFVTFPCLIISLLIYIIDTKYERREEKMNKEIEVVKNPKTLVIIPAHNEAQNIQKVIDELKSDFQEADILILNDASTDNTKEIVGKNGVPCIDTIFNLRYAYTIQTGIKYAKQKGYDYVIQFDGDGQHIALEAKKLLKTIKEKECDIVIGSRYLEKGNYKPAFFRNLGTKIFSFFIKLFCRKKITDPLSGFQILNKRVIEEYSKMGHYPEYPDANLVIEMILKGYKIEEVSVKMRLREFGESMHGGIIKPIKYMITMVYTVVIIIVNNIFRRRNERKN